MHCDSFLLFPDLTVLLTIWFVLVYILCKSMCGTRNANQIRNRNRKGEVMQMLMVRQIKQKGFLHAI